MGTGVGKGEVRQCKMLLLGGIEGAGGLHGGNIPVDGNGECRGFGRKLPSSLNSQAASLSGAEGGGRMLRDEVS